MNDPEEATRDVEVRRTVYRGIAGSFAVFLFMFSPFSLLVIGWFADFEDSISHRVHEVAFGALFAMILVGAVSQLGHAERQVAGLLQMLGATASLAIVVSASTGPEITLVGYVVPPLALLALHPDLRAVIRAEVRPMRGMVGALAVALLPMVVLAWSNFDKALDRVQGHESHWGAMAAFGVTIVLVVGVAALGLPGWRVAACSAGAAMAAYATVSLAFRFDASALALTQAVAALAWSAVVVAIAVRGDGATSTVVRPMDGRLVAGVAAALAHRSGVSPAWFRAGFVLAPILGPLAYLALWAILPAAPTTRRVRLRLTTRSVLVGAALASIAVLLGPGAAAVGIPLAMLGIVVASAARLEGGVVRRIGGFAAGVGVASALGVFVGLWTSDRAFVTPVVPHQIESIDTAYCSTCHVAGGARGAPIVQISGHPYDQPIVGRCVSCHDHLPIAGTPSAASWHLGMERSDAEAFGP